MFASHRWDEGLDDAQLEAVLHGEEPLVIMAGAGTGKTRTLTARVARLLESGVAPERIVLLTFTRRAADDMLERAALLAGRSELARRLRGGTFHAVAHQVIGANAGVLGLPEGFSVLDPGDAADVMELLADEHGLVSAEVRMPRAATLVDIYSRCVNTQRPVTEVVEQDFPWCASHIEGVAALCAAYVARKRRHDQLDFDDLLIYWRAALADPVLGPQLAASFDHVLVDEYQDVNALQVDIVRALRPGGRGLTVVGDDAQAVYGFRGADARHLSELAASLPDAAVVRLERNFRSRQPLLATANALRPADTATITLYGDRPGGERPTLVRCYDAPAEARAVARRILAARETGLRLSDQAVLVRAAHHSDLIELELTARRIPYRKYGGLRFLEAAHVKDYVAAVRLLDNPADDVAWFRVLRLHEGIGPARARSLLDLLVPHGSDPLARWADAVAAAPARSRLALAATFEGLEAARSQPGTVRPDAVLAVVRPLVAGHYREPAVRLDDLGRLADAAAVSGDLRRWTAEVTLDPPVSSGDLARDPSMEEDYVVISTVHSAKGLEWPAVHLPHLVDGAFPSDMALHAPSGLAEERRLFYVAATRARDQLTLYCPLRMPHHRRAGDDRHSLAPASRFLDQAALATLQVVDEAESRPAVDTGAGGPPVLVELDALWR